MKVGDYVRTKGYITKIDSCTCWKAKNQWYISYKLPNGSDCASAVTDEFKISSNIIDLIEYDDILKIIYEDKEYICKVVDVGGIRGVQLTSTLSVDLGIVEAGIKSIVTKKQFESMEYKVGE